MIRHWFNLVDGERSVVLGCKWTDNIEDLSFIYIPSDNFNPPNWHDIITSLDYNFLFSLIRGNENIIWLNELNDKEGSEKMLIWLKYVLRHVWYGSNLYSGHRGTPDESGEIPDGYDSLFRGQYKAISEDNKKKLAYLKRFIQYYNKPNFDIRIRVL